MFNKKLGVISGMGTRAGLLFLNKLIDKIDAKKDQDFPEFLLHNNSQVPDRTLAIVYSQESPMNELKRSIEIMKRNEVDYIVSTCITSYHYLNQMDDSVKKILLNPFDAIAEKLLADYNYIKKVGLLATTGAIQSNLFHNKFKSLPFELVTLSPHSQEEKFMKSVYMEGGFKSSEISEEAYCLFNNALEDLLDKEVDLIIGGCTEVQIGIKKSNVNFLYIDIIDVLIDEVIKKIGLSIKKEEYR